VGRRLALLAASLVLGACGTTGSSSTPSSSTTIGPSTTTSPDVSTPPTDGPALRLTADGIGPLRIGMTLEEAEATGLVGSFEPGCEVESPPPMSAPLRQVEGTVDAADGRVRSITVRRSNEVATDPGLVEPGDPVDEAVTAWEAAGLAVTVDKDQEDIYGVWFVQVRNGSDPAFEATANPALGTLDAISVPEVVLCE
jgi:hypothetical protein